MIPHNVFDSNPRHDVSKKLKKEKLLKIE